MVEAVQEHDRLRLSPEDVALLCGIVDGFLAHGRVTSERWPRLERIAFDLEVMMRKQEATDV